MCTSLNGEGCLGDSVVFGRQAPNIHVSASLNNAPEDTKVNFTWYYVDSARTKIGEFNTDMSTLKNSGSAYTLHCTVNRPDGGWPVGNYEVEIKINTDNSKPLVRKFSVKEVLEWTTFLMPRYSIQYPSNWTFEQGTCENGQVCFKIWSPKETGQDTIYEMVSLMMDVAKGANLDECVKKAEKDNKPGATDHSFRENKRIKSSSGEYHLLTWSEYFFVEDKNSPLLEIQLRSMLINDTLYSLQVGGTADKLAKYKEITEKMMSSFAVKK
jgi:hypothetical protein